MSNRYRAPEDAADQALLPGPKQGPETTVPDDKDLDFWLGALRDALTQRSHRSLAIAEQGLKAYPTDPELLLQAALTAIASGKPERSLALLKRYGKRYVPNRPVALLTALALGDQEQYAQALALLRAERLDTDRAALTHFVGEEVMTEWLLDRLRTIRLLGSLPRKRRRSR